jgi:hypothetical protein
MTIHIHVIGWLLCVLALVHGVFPRYFRWKSELRSLGLMNRQMMQVHTFFIAIVVWLMGLMCITSAADLQATGLGKRIALGLAVFWSIRLVVQLFWYSPALWRGRFFETAVHVVFTLFWVYMSVVFWVVAIS